MSPKMELRIWEKSSLIGKTKEEIEKLLDIRILKVSRGIKATNPPDDLVIESADYVTFIGDEKGCGKMLDESAPSEE